MDRFDVGAIYDLYEPHDFDDSLEQTLIQQSTRRTEDPTLETPTTINYIPNDLLPMIEELQTKLEKLQKDKEVEEQCAQEKQKRQEQQRQKLSSITVTTSLVQSAVVLQI